MKYLFVLFIVLFVSCKEHSTEPVFNNVPLSSKPVIVYDTLNVQVIVIENPLTKAKMVLDFNSIKFLNSTNGNYASIYSNGSNLTDLHLSAYSVSVGAFLTSIAGNTSFADGKLAINSGGEIVTTDNEKFLLRKINTLESRLAELESKFETTEQNF
jgi:hypothetical protein